jgi:hypothetical protein
LFLPTHLHQFNKFLRTIWRNFWCQSFVSDLDWNFQLIFVMMRFTSCNNFINNNSLYLILTSAIALAERKCRHYT